MKRLVASDPQADAATSHLQRVPPEFCRSPIPGPPLPSGEGWGERRTSGESRCSALDPGGTSPRPGRRPKVRQLPEGEEDCSRKSRSSGRSPAAAACPEMCFRTRRPRRRASPRPTRGFVGGQQLPTAGLTRQQQRRARRCTRRRQQTRPRPMPRSTTPHDATNRIDRRSPRRATCPARRPQSP